MRSDPPPVKRITLPEMNKGPDWTMKWKFTVEATAGAKCVVIEDGKGDMGGRQPSSDTGSD
jgi:hypothetical protein